MAIACAMCCLLCFHVECTIIQESLPLRSGTNNFLEAYLAFLIKFRTKSSIQSEKISIQNSEIQLFYITMSAIFIMMMVHFAHPMKFSFHIGLQI
jgi:hypothetical protein